MRSGLAKSTIKTYDTAWCHFTQFCGDFNVPVLPVNFSAVCAFIMQCREQRKMRVGSIKGYLSGIQFHMRCLDPTVCGLLGNPSVKLLLDGMRKGSSSLPDKRLPFSLHTLHLLVTHLRGGIFGPYNDLLLEAVFLAAFYGFMRCGEFTACSEVFNSAHDLTVSDLSFQGDHFSLFPRLSKSDGCGKRGFCSCGLH